VTTTSSDVDYGSFTDRGPWEVEPDKLSWKRGLDQIRADAQKLADAGVDESFFDVSFQPDVNDLKSYLGYMDRFRAILEVPVAV